MKNSFFIIFDPSQLELENLTRVKKKKKNFRFFLLFKSFTFRKTKINKKKSFFGFDSSQIEADSS